jgi:hypothetical protein
VDEKLRVAERWDRTEKLLGMLDAAPATAPWSARE